MSRQPDQTFKRLPHTTHRDRWQAYEEHGYNQQAAANALGISYSTFRQWRVAFQEILEAETEFSRTEPKKIKKAFWEKFVEVDPRNNVPEAEEEEPKDLLDERRHEQEIARLKRERKEALDRAVRAEDIRASVFGLTEAPLEPVTFQPAIQNVGGPSAETIIADASDWHWGEEVDYYAMDGLNSYNPTIAAARAERFFQALLDLSTKHWAEVPPERLLLLLGGDMIAGEIHEELKKTNRLMAIPAVRDVVRHLTAGLVLLREHLECPIDVISVPGNHGRSTLKPESKNYVLTSYDTLVSEFLELQLQSHDNIQFYAPLSGDAYFSVYGWKFLCTHGDRIGTGGGQGFIGPAAPAARGMKKLVQDYAARGQHIDYVIINHFHTALALEEGFVNGSLVGHNEFATKFRMKPRPATQLFLAVHPRRGISQYRFINVGDPDEGSLYERPEPSEIRPHFNLNR